MTAGHKNNDISRRYARALFALAREANVLGPVGADLAALQKALDDSAELRSFINNAALRRDDQARALAAIAAKAQWAPLTQKFLGTLARNRRLAELPQIIAAVLAEIAAQRGEVTADVTVAQALDAAQEKAIIAALGKITGKDVKLHVTQDAGIVGGLIVKVGSQLIDGSVRSKLERLHRALKNQNTSQNQKKIREVA